jgi:GT2 family glycosyltransferase
VRVVEVSRPGGAAAARNAAAAAARASVLAFLDSDVVPDPGWLAAGLQVLVGEGRTGAVEGATVVRDRAGIGPFTHQTENLAGGRFPACNLFVRRQAFEDVGGFDVGFAGAGFPFREDSDFAFRLLDRGWLIPFAAHAVVDHPPLEGSYSLPLRLARRYRHDLRLRLRHPRRFRRDLDVHRLLGIAIARPRQRAYAVHVLLAAAAAAGLLLGAPFWLTALLGSACGLTYFIILAAHRPWRARRPLDALAILPVAALVPFVYASSVLGERLRGVWR